MATSARRALTDIEIVAIIEDREAKAESATLAEARAKALDYYMGEPFGNEVEDRSQIVSRDVFEVVEWIKPSIMRIFCGGDEVVKFEPMGPEDVNAAAQETAYINYLMLERGEGFTTLYEWFTDALLGRNGYLLSMWDERVQVSEERYQGLTDAELQMLLGDESIEVLEHDLEQQSGPDGEPQTFHDVRIRVTEKEGRVASICIPPERVLVDAHHDRVSLAEADFVEYWEDMSLSDLRQMGLDVPDDIAAEERSSVGSDIVNTARFRNDPTRMDDTRNVNDPSMRLVRVRTVFLRVDADGDGIAELRRLLVVGRQILREDVYSRVTIAALTPTIVPHRHEGLSVADAVMDLQLIKSMLVRGQLDNMYLANNGRYAVDEDRVNLDDLLTSRPGGIVRVMGDPGGAVLPLTHPVLGNQVLQFIEYLDGSKEERTGVSRLNQGIDANTLNKTASGQQALQAAANQRIELIARVFAETGVKEHFRNLHMLVLQHREQPDVVELLGKWVNVDPREWRNRKNLKVSVGLGTGDSAGKVQNLQAIATAQLGVRQMGLAGPKQMYKALSDMTKAMGFKNGAEYWTDPTAPGAEPPPQQPADPSVLAKQAELQQRQQAEQVRAVLESKKLDTEAFDRQQQRQADREKAFLDAQVKLATAALSQDASRGQVKREVAQQMGVTTDDEAELQQQHEQQQAIAVLTQQVGALTQAVAQLAKPKPRLIRHHRDASGRVIASEAVDQPTRH